MDPADESYINACITTLQGVTTGNMAHRLPGVIGALRSAIELSRFRTAKLVVPTANGEQQLKAEIAFLAAGLEAGIAADNLVEIIHRTVDRLRQLSAV